MNRRLLPVLVLTFTAWLAPAAADAQPQPADSAAVVAAIEAYHEALSSGDGEGALALLADDAQIAESGGLETKEEYASHHLPGDMAYAAAMDRTSTFASVHVVGDVAWAMSTSHTHGTFRDREIDSRGAELMVLRRESDGSWRITAIHWSARRGG
jgi:ketosteroid isomerase-like protein